MLLFPCPRAASTFLRSARRDYGTRRRAALRGCDTIYAQDDACPATRTTYPYPHDAASRIIIATCLVIPCLHPHLHSSIPTRHGTQFHLHLRLAFGGTWFLFRCLALVSVASVPYSRAMPCYLRRVLPSTLLGRGSPPPLGPQPMCIVYRSHAYSIRSKDKLQYASIIGRSNVLVWPRATFALRLNSFALWVPVVGFLCV